MRSRTITSAGLAGAAAVALATAGAAEANRPASEGGSSKPSANMERVLLAAQLDPGRPGTGKTKGAKASVLLVERALKRKGLLEQKYVDGSYGSSTIAAYSAWQRRLGYSGIGANGLPGRTSLTKLGGDRFRVSRVVSVGKRVTVSGVTLNQRTNRMLKAAQKRVGGGCVPDLVQGSYSTSVGASAGTHDGGGAIDISVNRDCGLSKRAKLVKSLRQVGFAAWYRTTADGFDPHIHAIAVSDPDLATQAREQVSDYYQGRNGLANNGPDSGPKVKKTTWEQYRRAN